MTLQECKDFIARKEGHADWITCCFRENLTSMELIFEQVAKKYAEEKVNEQRDLMAKWLANHFNMRNVPKPKFDETPCHLR